jgi:hypothetical protein
MARLVHEAPRRTSREEASIADVGDRRVLDIDGRTVIFEITIAQVPVPRPFLCYRFYQGGRAVDGVLAEVKGFPASVREQFQDAELTSLFRTARRRLEREKGSRPL